MVNRFMVIDEPVPMFRIYHWRTYGLHIRYNTTAEGTIDWVGHGKQSQVLYKTFSSPKSSSRG
jgi:hypothetical protein